MRARCRRIGTAIRPGGPGFYLDGKEARKLTAQKLTSVVMLQRNWRRFQAQREPERELMISRWLRLDLKVILYDKMESVRCVLCRVIIYNITIWSRLQQSPGGFRP